MNSTKLISTSQLPQEQGHGFIVGAGVMGVESGEGQYGAWRFTFRIYCWNMTFKSVDFGATLTAIKRLVQAND